MDDVRSPKEMAASLYDKNVEAFRIVQVPENAIPHFALEATRNDIAELEMRRKEIWTSNDWQYTEGYWERVKQEVSILK